MCRFASSAAVISGMLLASRVCAAPGDLLWGSDFDRGSFDAVRDIAAADGRIFAAGLSNAVGNADMAVRAYDALDGTLIWENHYDHAGLEDEANSVAVSGGRVFVAGFTSDSLSRNFSVRAYRASDGDTLWEDHFDRAGGFDQALAVAATEERVFVVGQTTMNTGVDFAVRAYSASDGDTLWQDHFDRDGSADSAVEVATDGERVFVVGRTTVIVDGSPFFDLSTRVYQASDGSLLWKNDFNRGASGGEACAVTLGAGRVFVGGDTFAPEGDGEFGILAFDVTDSTIVWQDHFDRAGGRDFVFAIAVDGNRVFAAGQTLADSTLNCPPSRNDDFSVRAYDAADGDTLWQNHFDLAGSSDQSYAVAAASGMVLVAGRSQDADCNLDWLVRTYDGVDGALLWEVQYDRGGGSDEAQTVVVLGTGAFVGGRTDSVPSSLPDFSVRAYQFLSPSDVADPPTVANVTLFFSNPFTPSAELHCSFRNPDRVCVEIVDLAGRTVRHLFDGHGVGERALSWNGLDDRHSRVASGVYFVRVRGPREQYSRTLVLVR